MILVNRIALFFFVSLSLAFGALTELQKIDALIFAVEESGVLFNRNGQDHSSVDAAKHLRDKLNAAIKSPFSPKKTHWTAEMFIERIGSKSSTTGKDYLIKLPDGGQMKAKVWLTQKLNEIVAKNP